MSTPIELLIPTDTAEIRLRGQLSRIPDPAPRPRIAVPALPAVTWMDRTAAYLRGWIPRARRHADHLIFGSQGVPVRGARSPQRPVTPAPARPLAPSEAIRPVDSPLRGPTQPTRPGIARRSTPTAPFDHLARA